MLACLADVRLDDFILPENLPTTLPVLALRRGVLLPGGVMPLQVGRAASLGALDAADRRRCGPVAPADGLYLLRVDYPDGTSMPP